MAIRQQSPLEAQEFLKWIYVLLGVWLVVSLLSAGFVYFSQGLAGTTCVGPLCELRNLVWAARFSLTLLLAVHVYIFGWLYQGFSIGRRLLAISLSALSAVVITILLYLLVAAALYQIFNDSWGVYGYNAMLLVLHILEIVLVPLAYRNWYVRFRPLD